jgi:hypothetical protein
MTRWRGFDAVTPTDIALLCVIAAVAVSVFLWMRASRIDRLHRRIELAWSSLRLQLARRASVALALAHAEVWDPKDAAAVEAAARAALLAGAGAPGHSELTRVLREALGGPEDVARLTADPAKAALLKDLAGAWYRATLARRFLNDAVSLTLRLRGRRLVRWFHLAGRTAMPASCDLDDAAPDGFSLT